MHKNFKNIDKVCYGRGSFSQLGEILEPVRGTNNGFMLFVVDHYFKGKERKRGPWQSGDGGASRDFPSRLERKQKARPEGRTGKGADGARAARRGGISCSRPARQTG